jgi:hypothetical protein
MNKSKLRFAKRFAVAAAFTLGLIASAQADSAIAPALKNMETMVTNLGYTTTESTDKTFFTINVSSNNNSYIFNFMAPDDGQTLVIYSPAQSIPLASAGKMPVLDMLDFGDHSDNYYTAEKFPDHFEIFLNTELTTAGLTPGVLRVRLQGLVDDLDKSKSIWDSTSWK